MVDHARLTVGRELLRQRAAFAITPLHCVLGDSVLRRPGRLRVAHPSVADVMNRVRQPFNVNSLALAAAAAALDDMEFVAKSYAENLQGMRQLTEGFRALGLDYIPSHGNFVTVRVGKAGDVFKRLLRRGVIVRPVAGYAMPEHLRVTVGTAQENEKFLQALAPSLKE